MKARVTIRGRGRSAGTRQPLVVLLAATLLIGLPLVASLPSRAQDAPVPVPVPDAGARPLVLQLAFDGAIGPAAERYIVAGLDRAERDAADAVLLLLDTPGGLDGSMRAIIKAMLASARPIILFVYPSGSRAASAGTFMAYASHVAAMAPGTNLGAATPVSLVGRDPPREPSPTRSREASPTEASDAADASASGKTGDGAGAADGAAGGAADAGADEGRSGSDEDSPSSPETTSAMTSKVTNDAVAYIRSLAELRGRNADWAESAVRDAKSLSAEEALAMDVIDLVARDPAELLERVSGRVVTAGDEEITLALSDARVEVVDPDWRTRVLAVITNPNVALLLMAIGFYGIVFELFSPGALFPGTLGAISLLLGLYALSVLPFDLAGIALMLLGLGLMAGEAFVPSFGVLGIGGLVAFVLGAGVLSDADVPGFTLAWPLVIGIAVASLLSIVLIVRLAMTSRRRKVVTGRRGLTGSQATVDDWAGERGHVFCDGERWTAVSGESFEPGQSALVVSVTGNTLTVASAPTATSPQPEGSS